MLTTEEQAKEKWCPHTRQLADKASYNRTAYGDVEDVLCLGSACMAWRWAKDPLVEFVANGHPTNTRTEYGYCGLAGKP